MVHIRRDDRFGGSVLSVSGLLVDTKFHGRGLSCPETGLPYLVLSPWNLRTKDVLPCLRGQQKFVE